MRTDDVFYDSKRADGREIVQISTDRLREFCYELEQRIRILESKADLLMSALDDANDRIFDLQGDLDAFKHT